MNWLINALTPYRSQLFALVGVLAVCGVGATSVAWLYIRLQGERITAQASRIDGLLKANGQWAAHARDVERLRALEQDNVLLLQDKLALIQRQNAAAALQLEQLEATNAEVKDYLARPIPADLRRLLGRQ
ncbi:hypothetical protein GRI97_10540 [Altererythrobacter xixiisoli]|uniref:Uncharacterized protein n=1 Tax=Croceibacterium xixiisoli TaxID=1476466 RepID=A0A6I4TXR0_9SPHN|nr:hypothetical protein [Croceibacterium xixiisoli]MXO99428.1 hypothetical protein [Croceibacterium xixiisoli]